MCAVCAERWLVVQCFVPLHVFFFSQPLRATWRLITNEGLCRVKWRSLCSNPPPAPLLFASCAAHQWSELFQHLSRESPFSWCNKTLFSTDMMMMIFRYFCYSTKVCFPLFHCWPFFFFFFSCALRHTHQQVGMMEQKSSTPSPAHCNRQSFFLFCFFFFSEYCYSCFSLCFWVSGFWFKNTRHEVWMYESISKISKCGWCTSSMSRLPGLTCVFRSCVAQEGLYICKIRIRLWVMPLTATYLHEGLLFCFVLGKAQSGALLSTGSLRIDHCVAIGEGHKCLMLKSCLIFNFIICCIILSGLSIFCIQGIF